MLLLFVINSINKNFDHFSQLLKFVLARKMDMSMVETNCGQKSIKYFMAMCNVHTML